MTLLKTLYGLASPFHIPYFLKDFRVESADVLLRDRDEGIQVLKFYLGRAQNRMKHIDDRNRSERQFEVGDRVFMKLQPYRKHTLKSHRNQNFQSKNFSPFQVLEKIGLMAYRLNLPSSAAIHPVIHVSQLKLTHGKNED